jgi:hypothetical protein
MDQPQVDHQVVTDQPQADHKVVMDQEQQEVMADSMVNHQ